MSHPLMHPAIEIIDLSMQFGSFTALKHVNLRWEPHQVHVLLGENGAGKSTLVKCLIGYQKQTGGQIVLQGEETNFYSPKDASEKGIGMVYQHFSLGDQLSVIEHFAITHTGGGRLSWKSLRKDLTKFMESMPFRLDLDTNIGDLSAGEKQKLEILLQLFKNPEILILDEPSSVLTPQEANEILGLLKEMVNAKKLTIILITHKFRELRLIGDTVSVLRRGELVGFCKANEKTDEELAALMVGEDFKQAALSSETTHLVKQKSSDPQAPVLISVQKLNFSNNLGHHVLKDLSFEVRAGEIYGLAGVSGNGQKELVEILSGLHPVKAGTIRLMDKEFLGVHSAHSPISIIPELPLQNACVSTMTLWENLSFRDLELPAAYLKKHASNLQQSYHIKAQSIFSPIKSLSGGNVQRAVLARELRESTKILIASNPCFGLDFKASYQIRSALVDAAQRGTAVFLISEDLDEILSLSDRVGVMFEGSITYEKAIAEVQTKDIGAHMGGSVKEAS